MIDAQRKPVDASAMALMLLLCMLWGFQTITIKLASGGISTIMQAALRSLAAALLLLLWSRARGVPLFGRDGTLAAGIGAGLLFGVEFAFIYGGLAHTNASRMSVFVFMAPCFTALGLALTLPGERLRPRQWSGVALAFGGIVVAFAEGFGAARGATWIGDLCGVAGALLWAATTVLIRNSALNRASAEKTLFYQLAVSAALLPALSLALGEPGVMTVNALVVACMLYQAVLVTFASYLTWFWLLTRYLAAQLSVFSFATPLFGVAFGALLLDEPVSAALAGAALLVGGGITLVNLPPRLTAVRE